MVCFFIDIFYVLAKIVLKLGIVNYLNGFFERRLRLAQPRKMRSRKAFPLPNHFSEYLRL